MVDIFQDYEPDEIQILAEFKRLVERYTGDSAFRRMACDVPSQRPELLSNLGIRLDCLERGYLWRHFEDRSRFRLTESDLADSPDLKLWIAWKRAFHDHVCRLNEAWVPSDKQRLAAWRNRRIRRFASETGVTSRAIIFPFFAYELSKGCSIGCWFCGLSAERFQGFFPYTRENARLWRELLQIGLDLCGPGCQASLCYHATEPFDNPDYLHFLKDFHTFCGIYPQTTTAAPLKNLSLTRELLRLRDTSPILQDRFSVLSVKSLKEIHQTFSPYELRYVQLILHNKGALGYKTNCGGARKHPQKLTEANRIMHQYDGQDNPPDPFTIECVCGYLVNLVERSVKLISPCSASDRWPNGYRIHAEGAFRDAPEYKAFLERTMEECMPLKAEWKDNVRFRPDLTFERLEDGFSLTSRAYRHSLHGKTWYAALGELIAKGETTRGQIIARFASEGVPLLEVTSILQKVFDKGVLEDDDIPEQG